MLSYKQQDPKILEEIKREVCVDRNVPAACSDQVSCGVQILERCPTLEIMYPDGWPITSYLRVALKKRRSIDSDRNNSKSLRAERMMRPHVSRPLLHY